MRPHDWITASYRREWAGRKNKTSFMRSPQRYFNEDYSSKLDRKKNPDHWFFGEAIHVSICHCCWTTRASFQHEKSSPFIFITMENYTLRTQGATLHTRAARDKSTRDSDFFHCVHTFGRRRYKMLSCQLGDSEKTGRAIFSVENGVKSLSEEGTKKWKTASQQEQFPASKKVT